MICGGISIACLTP
ncbi:hypothetical protein M2G63_21775 [Vibrio vulnificus]|nr:hypothetical protein [Vibrio vulnificus]MCU8545088.1 hypothetical protein [Vibrio vulnificus]